MGYLKEDIAVGRKCRLDEPEVVDNSRFERFGDIMVDLKRTDKLLERVKAYNPDAKVNIKEHHLLRPIPQTQLDAIINKDEFGQNAGYN